MFWVLAAVSITDDNRRGLFFTVPAAAFLFVLQHDCGHGSLFPSRRASDRTGRALGALTFTPYDYWRRTRAVHHASAGDLDRRGIGDVLTLTVVEYRALSSWGQSEYRLIRSSCSVSGPCPSSCPSIGSPSG